MIYQRPQRAIDFFAGAGGWSQACRNLGIDEVGIEIMPEANATRKAAGFATIDRDVREISPNITVRHYTGLIASPPCQTFSKAGKGSGRDALDIVTKAAHMIAEGHTGWRDYAATSGDPRTALVLEPLRAVLDAEDAGGRFSVRGFDWVALEQVPTVQPVWEVYAEILRERGYSVDTGILSAEQYGVPQTRRRAILVASRERTATLPKPTHSKYHFRDPSRVDPGLPKWISMAEALGWDEGSVGFPRKADGLGEDIDGYRARDLRSTDKPAFVVTEKARSWERRIADQSGTPVDLDWPLNRPSTTVAHRDLVQHPGATANRHNGSTKSRNDGIRVTVEEAGLLQSFPAEFPWQGSRTKQYLQIGNAIPVCLAQHILAQLIV